MLDRTFLVVERQEARDGTWTLVATDTDIETKYVKPNAFVFWSQMTSVELSLVHKPGYLILGYHFLISGLSGAALS